MEEENKAVEEITRPIYINFKVDIPFSVENSIFNSIILGLAEYENMNKLVDMNPDKPKILNEILRRIQRQIDDLIIFEE